MKVAIVTATYPPYRGGTGNVCAAHAAGLRELGHDVHVFTTGKSQAEQSTDTVHRLRPLLRIGNGMLLPQLLWQLRGFDIIHWHYPFFGGEFTALAARLTRTPLVVTYHQDVILDGWMGRLARFLENSVGRWALRSATTVLFTSEDYGRHSNMRRHLLTEQVAALSNGVDVERFRKSAAQENQVIPLLELSIPKSFHTRDRLTLLLVAGLDAAHYFKGVSVLLKALAQTQNAQLILVGDGSLRSQYEQEACEHGIAERTFFARSISNSALIAYYQFADFTVLPSTTMGEAFGLVLVESLASGTPVIASNLPGVRTVVEHGADGYLVPPNNPQALTDVIDKASSLDSAVRSEMGESGRRKVTRQYAWSRVCQQLSDMYAQVAAAGGSVQK